MEGNEDPFTTAFSPEQVTALNENFQSKGIEGMLACSKEMESNLDRSINIAVTGQAGSGKSSFVNAMRGLKPSHIGAAAVGFTETTREPTEYKHPQYPNIAFWDLPGSNTPNFPLDGYTDLVGFQRYDFFILITADRFKDSDVKLAEDITSRGKSFIFVRSKLDQDVRNSSRDYPGKSTVQVISEIRNEILKNLKSNPFQLKITEIFLISSQDVLLYDFGRLEQYMVELLEGKRASFLKSLRPVSEKIIEEKVKSLRKSVVFPSLQYGFGKACIPGYDEDILVKTISEYIKQLGLDEESMERLSLDTKVSREILEAARRYASNTSYAALLKAIQALVGVFGSRMGNSKTGVALTALATAAGGSVYFVTARKMLNKTLDELEEDAKNVLRKAVESL